MKKENYLLIRTGWDDTGLLIPLSSVALLKDALYMKTVRKKDPVEKDKVTYLNIVEPFKADSQIRTSIISFETVEAANVAGQMFVPDESS
jgi:hypothetical protein